MNESEVMGLWLYASEIWQHFNIPDLEREPDMVDIKTQAWMRNLGDLDARLVQAAIDRLSTQDHPPKVGQIRDAALRLAALERGEPQVPDGDEAWAEVRRAFGAVGRYRTPEWSHPAIAAAVDAMGWKELCDSTDEGISRGQFAKLYAQARDRVTRHADPPAPALSAFYREGALAGIKRADDAIGAGSE